MVTVKFRTYGMLLFVECRVPSFSPSDLEGGFGGGGGGHGYFSRVRLTGIGSVRVTFRV